MKLFPRDAAAAEKRAVSLILVGLLLAITLPYLWAMLIVPEGFHSGGLLYNPDDQNVHLAWARQARDGHFFFRDLFTHESLQARPLFTNFFALLIGWLSALTTLPLVVFYHLLRLAGAVALFFAFYALCARLTKDVSTRMVALSLMAFGGGVGYLSVWLPGRLLMDNPEGAMPMPEAFTFPSLLVFSLNAVSLALLGVIFLNVLRAWQSGLWKSVWPAALAAFLLANIHTYDAIPLNLTMLLWAAYGWFSSREAPLKKVRVLTPLLVALATLPMLLYQVYVFRHSIEFQLKAKTPTLPPSLLDFLLSYGLLYPLALVALYFAWKKNHERESTFLMALWAGAITLCVYLPGSIFPFARRMIEGLHLPLCLLAATGVVQLARAWKLAPLPRRVLSGGVIALMALSSLRWMLWTAQNAETNNLGNAREAALMPPLYLSAGDRAALDYLNASPANRDRAVLSLTPLGNYIPRETGRAVYIGHWAETLGYWNEATRSGKLGEAQRFYGGKMNEAQARQFLRENNIGYVIVGFYEKRRGFSLPMELPIEKDFGAAQLYRVPR